MKKHVNRLIKLKDFDLILQKEEKQFNEEKNEIKLEQNTIKEDDEKNFFGKNPERAPEDINKFIEEMEEHINMLDEMGEVDESLKDGKINF